MSPPSTPPAGTSAHAYIKYTDTNGNNAVILYLTWSNSDQMWEDSGGDSLQLDSADSEVAVDGGPPWDQTWGGVAQWDIILNPSNNYGFYGNTIPDNSGNLTQIPNPIYTSPWSDLDSTNSYCIFSPLAVLNAFTSGMSTSYPYSNLLSDAHFY